MRVRAEEFLMNDEEQEMSKGTPFPYIKGFFFTVDSKFTRQLITLKWPTFTWKKIPRIIKMICFCITRDRTGQGMGSYIMRKTRRSTVMDLRISPNYSRVSE